MVKSCVLSDLCFLLSGILLDDDMGSDIYIFTIHSTFFEFIHMDNMEEENPPTLFIDQVYTAIHPKANVIWTILPTHTGKHLI